VSGLIADLEALKEKMVRDLMQVKAAGKRKATGDVTERGALAGKRKAGGDGTERGALAGKRKAGGDGTERGALAGKRKAGGDGTERGAAIDLTESDEEGQVEEEQ
jgi:hypothetical protein